MNEYNYNTEFSRCLVELDVVGIRKLWAHTNPGLPQPKNDEQTLITLHMARTSTNSLALRLRAYSHSWLTERGFPSGLPDELKPKAERMYPRVVNAVGVSVNFTAKELKPAAALIEKSMSESVLGLYADGEQRPDVVRKIMMEVGIKERKKLLGRRG